MLCARRTVKEWFQASRKEYGPESLACRVLEDPSCAALDSFVLVGSWQSPKDVPRVAGIVEAALKAGTSCVFLKSQEDI